VSAAAVALIVLAKSPRPGRVKTRLCPPCTPEQAAGLAEAALIDTLVAVGATAARRRVLALDGRPGRWMVPGFSIVAQRGRGLGERLAAAFDSVGGPALLVGMDTPQLAPERLRDAAGALTGDGPDAVLGPADDGGYWSIGLRRADARVFEGVPMSTADTGRVQLERLRELGLEVGLLPALRDVDRYEDALAVAREAPGTRFAAAVDALTTEVPVA
jgi:rSAM/selenodomain-associated transferase 1